MHFPPRSEHQWRQSDAYSMTLNYYYDDLNFFEPAVHSQRSIKGKAVGEFPVIYYLDAAIWKITGPSIYLVRLLNLLIAFFGLFALFRLIYEIIQDKFIAYIVPLLIYSAPLFAYYSNSFLVNIDALSFLFISWYFLYKYSSSQRYIHLIPALLFVSLAGLLRTTMLIGYFPILVWFLYSFISNRNVNLKVRIQHATLLLIPIFAIIAWILFIKEYNLKSHSTYFLTTINPIWQTPNKAEIWNEISTKTINEFYPFLFRFLLLLLITSLIFFYKKLNKFYLFLCGFIFLELVVYVFLWFQFMFDHDYYLIELLILIPPLSITLFILLKEKYNVVFKSKYLRIGLTVGLIVLLLNGAAKTRIKYDKKAFFITKLFLTESEINQWSLRHWGYDQTLLAFESIEPYLDSIGIHKNDLVISVPDVSSNITLSLMNRKGFTFLYVDQHEIKRDMALFKEKGAKYLLLFKQNQFLVGEIQQYLSNKIGEYKNISVYKL